MSLLDVLPERAPLVVKDTSSDGPMASIFSRPEVIAAAAVIGVAIIALVVMIVVQRKK